MIIHNLNFINQSIIQISLNISKLSPVEIYKDANKGKFQVIQAELHYNIKNKCRFIGKKMKDTVQAIGTLHSNAKRRTVQLSPIVTLPYWLSFNMTKLLNEALETNETVIALKVYFWSASQQSSNIIIDITYLIY